MRDGFQLLWGSQLVLVMGPQDANCYRAQATCCYGAPDRLSPALLQGLSKV